MSRLVHHNFHAASNVQLDLDSVIKAKRMPHLERTNLSSHGTSKIFSGEPIWTLDTWNS